MATSIFDRFRAGVRTGSAESTRKAAAELSAALPPGTTLALHGDMGVGKTTFVQGLARGFGIHESITSPTFTIFNVHRGSTNLVHLDAYRLETARQVEDLLLLDFLESPWCLAVEWPDKISDWLPPDALHLELRIERPRHHAIRLRGQPEAGKPG